MIKVKALPNRIKHELETLMGSQTCTKEKERESTNLRMSEIKLGLKCT